MPYQPWILGVLAALLHGTAYILYNLQAKSGDSKPNVVSWSIWAFMSALNASSFASVTSFAHALQYMVGTVAAIITFLLSLFWGKFAWPSKKETTILALCVVAVVAWQTFQNPGIANVLGLVAFVISFEPTIAGVYRDPNKETALPWTIWTIALAVNVANNLASWNGGWISIINPVVLLFCHGSVAFLSTDARKQRLTPA